MKLERRSTELRDPLSYDHEGRGGIARRTLGSILSDRADKDRRIVVATADLAWSTFVAEFMERHPNRFIQAGIGERNMLGMAAGLAEAGYIPYVTTFSAFASMQCLDVIRNDHAYTNLPVRTIGTHCGISMGYFASSHHAIEDIGALRSVPNLTVCAPADLVAVEALIRDTHELPGPVYFRLGRGADGPPVYKSIDQIKFGDPAIVERGTDLLVLTSGIVVHAARDAAHRLAKEGRGTATVVDLHTLKPFPDEVVAELASKHRAVLVPEDHLIDGGIGTSVQQAVLEAGVSVPIFKHGLTDFAIIGPPTHMYHYYAFDASGLHTIMVRALERADLTPKARRRSPLWEAADMQRVLEEQRKLDQAKVTV